jgi:hypothetical protein
VKPPHLSPVGSLTNLLSSISSAGWQFDKSAKANSSINATTNLTGVHVFPLKVERSIN